MTEHHLPGRFGPSLLTVLFTSLLCSLPGRALALGLGELKLNSALNEPLDAEIALLNAGEIGGEELLAGLATEADFARAGIDRDFFLAFLRFRTVLNGDNAVIKITSRRPVREPYLNFLVELQWPAGRMLREYTLLFDLPVFTSKTPLERQVEAAPSRAPVSRPAPEPEVDVRAAPGDLSGSEFNMEIPEGGTVIETGSTGDAAAREWRQGNPQ